MASPAALAVQWDARVSTIARNLTDFTDSDAARLVRARVDSYTGRTREAALEVDAAIKALQDNYLVLSGVVNDALRASRKPSLLTNRDAEILGLLEGPSVRLRTLTIPVSQRGLLDSAEAQDRVTPGAVLDAMQRTFTRVRDTVTAIATAEDALGGRVAVLQARIAALRGWQTATHVDVGVDGIAVGEFRSVDHDPLDAVARVDALEAEVQAAEAARTKADIALTSLRERLAAAARGLDVLRETYRAFGPACAALDGIAVERPRAARDETQDLADWLASLRRVLARGDLNPIGIGLDRWEASLALARTSAEAALSAARAPVAELEDLRGLLSALRAKGAALGGIAGGAERAAKAAVRAERVDLVQAQACVKAYEMALTSVGTRKVG